MKMNIKESLIKLDMDTDFKHSLTDLYEACRLDDDKKRELVQYIDGKDVESMSKMLSNEAGVMTENVSDDISDENMPEDIQMENYEFEDDYLSDAITMTMHHGKFLDAMWTDNHKVKYLKNDRYEVQHKVNGERVQVEFDTSDKSDSTLRFTVDGKEFVARYPNEAQNIIIDELEKKNLKQFDVVVEGLKAGDTVFVKPNKKLGKVKSVKGDYVEVEVMGGNDPDRIDTYYSSDLELQDNVEEDLLVEGPGAVLGDLAGKAVGDAWKGVKNFAKGVKDTAKDVAKTTKAVAKSAVRDAKQSKTGAKIRDAARAVKGANNWDEFKSDYDKRQAGRKLSDKARSQSYKGKIGKTIGDVQDWKFEVGGKKMNFDQFMKLPTEKRAELIQSKKVKCFDLSGRETSFQDQAKRLSGLKEALLLEYSEYRRILKEATAVMDRPKISNVHTHRGSFSGIIDVHMDEINDMISADVPATHIVHCLRDWVAEAELTKSNAKYAQNAIMRMAKMRTAEEVGMYLYNIRLKAEDDSYGSIDSQFYSKKHKYEDLNEELLRESADKEDKPFTHSQIFDELKLETANFSVGEDRGVYCFEKEAKMAEKILKKHYETVKVTPHGNDFMVEFSGPKNKKKKVNESKFLCESSKPYAYYINSNGLDKKIPVYIDEYEPGKFIWRDEVGESDDWFETKEMAYDNFVDFIKAELPNVVVDKYPVLTESVGRFELEVWVPGSGGDDRERFIIASNNLQDIIDKAYEIELDGDEAFYLRDMKDIYPYDLDQCYDAEELEDAIYNQWHYEPSADMRKQLGKILLPKNESLLGKRVQETNSYGRPVGKIGKVVSEDPKSKDHYGNYDIEVEYEDGSKQKTRAFFVQPIEEAYKENPRDFKCADEDGFIFDEETGKCVKIDYDENGEPVEVVKEAVELTADEMKDKYGTDNQDIISAGKPEEERVALKEAKTGQEYKGYIICYGCHETDRWYIKNSKDEFVGAQSGYSTEPEAREAIDAMNESLTEAMTYTDTNGFLGEPGETYTMSQFRRMWQDKDSDPVMSGYDTFEEWVGETISQMDAHEDADVAPSGRGKLSCAIFTDKSGIMGTAGEKYTVNDLADYWEANRGSDPVLANYNGDWKKWLDDTIEQMEIEYDSCLFEEGWYNATSYSIPNLMRSFAEKLNRHFKQEELSYKAVYREDVHHHNMGSDVHHVIGIFSTGAMPDLEAEFICGKNVGDWYESYTIKSNDADGNLRTITSGTFYDSMIDEIDEMCFTIFEGFDFQSVKSKGVVSEDLESKTFTDKEEAKKFAKANKGAITSVVDDKLNPTHYVHYKKEKDVKEAFTHQQNNGPFWYLCKHGIGPGALPKGVNIVDTVDDEENFNRVYVALDKVLTTDELSQFEMKEAKPPKMMKESLDFFDTVTVILDKDDMWGGYSKKMEDKYNWYQGQVIFEGDPRLKEIGAKPGDTVLCGLEPTDKFGDDIDFDIVPIKVLTTDEAKQFEMTEQKHSKMMNEATNIIKVIYKDPDFSSRTRSLEKITIEEMIETLSINAISKDDVLSVEGCTLEDLFPEPPMYTYNLTWKVIEKDDSVRERTATVKARNEQEALKNIPSENTFERKATRVNKE